MYIESAACISGGRNVIYDIHHKLSRFRGLYPLNFIKRALHLLPPNYRALVKYQPTRLPQARATQTP